MDTSRGSAGDEWKNDDLGALLGADPAATGQPDPPPLALFADDASPSADEFDRPSGPAWVLSPFDAEPVRRRHRRWIWIPIGVVAGLALVAVLGDALGGSPAPKVAAKADRSATSVALPATSTFSDDFERPENATDLGVASDGQRWDAVLGVWGIERGLAYISKPNGVGARRNIAVVDLGSPDGSITATVTGDGICGVVIRYSDPFNFIMLKRVSLYKVWNLEKVAGGKSSRVTFLADPRTPSVDVRIDARGSQIGVYVAGAYVAVDEPFAVNKSGVGFVAEQRGSAGCRWSSFEAWTTPRNG